MTSITTLTIPFDDWVLLPENTDQHYELINGEIVEKMVSNQKSSFIAGRIYFFLSLYVMQNPIGRLTPADGGYRIGTERYIPDVAFISGARQPTLNEDAYNPLAPDLAVEVLSPTDYNKPDEMRLKLLHYLAAGTVVWIVSPDSEHVEVWTPHQTPRILSLEDVLDGGEALPGFTLPIKQIFADTYQPPTESAE